MIERSLGSDFSPATSPLSKGWTGWLACFLVGVCWHGIHAMSEDALAQVSVELPSRPALRLRRVAILPPGPGTENSGMVRSRMHEDLFWLHNDSGNDAKLFSVRRNGEVISAAGRESPGVWIEGATNVDWEDIAADTQGRLIIADVGNNQNRRRDLVLYLLDEPDPFSERTAITGRYLVRYPDQQEFPAPPDEFNFDCEAIFTVGDAIHLLTKHRSDTGTKLYRLDDPRPEEVNVLTWLGSFDTRGPVTAADASIDGLRVVVLTYTSIWLFERESLDTPIFEGAISWAPIASWQMEAICFADEQTLLLVDERLGTMFEVSISDLTRVRELP